MEITRKMSVAGINGVRKGFKAVKQLEFIARLFGIVETALYEATQTGGAQWKFVGEFQGVNAEGKLFAAPVLYVPSPADSQLAQAIKDAAGKSVKFAYDIYIEPDATNPLGYVTKVKPLIDAAPVSALTDMAASLPTVVLTKVDLLSTPAATPAADPAPAPASADKPAKAPKK